MREGTSLARVARHFTWWASRDANSNSIYSASTMKINIFKELERNPFGATLLAHRINRTKTSDSAKDYFHPSLRSRVQSSVANFLESWKFDTMITMSLPSTLGPLSSLGNPYHEATPSRFFRLSSSSDFRNDEVGGGGGKAKSFHFFDPEYRKALNSNLWSRQWLERRRLQCHSRLSSLLHFQRNAINFFLRSIFSSFSVYSLI